MRDKTNTQFRFATEGDLCDCDDILFPQGVEPHLAFAASPSLPRLPAACGDGLHVPKVRASLSTGLPHYSGISAI